MKRRQAAVVFNDISGYTSLMQSNEEKAILLRQRHKEVVDRLTLQHNGIIIQYYGDGTLSIFDCASDAVQCAMSMQLEFRKPPEIPLRIGINKGDILLGPDGIYGDSVNIASRIERMSVPGSVLISSHVFEEIKGHEAIRTKDLGQFELKNVRHPINIHAVTNEGICVPETKDLIGKLGYKEKSIIVLPFYNLSKEPESEYFTDGITEQIIYALSELEGLRVTSRTSSFTFKDKHVNLRQLHQELGIDNVLEGSVRRHGKKVRITAQLINAADDFQLWSETYTRELCDVLQLQDEISLTIANKLKAEFQQSLSRRFTIPDAEMSSQSEVLEHYHKGRYEWKQMQPGYLDKSIRSFRKAVEEDRDFYPAWPSLAKAYAHKGYHNLMYPEEAATLCNDAVSNAERLDAGNAHTHVAKALYHLFFSWDFNKCENDLQLACKDRDHENFLLLNSVYHASGIYHIVKHDLNQAIVFLRKALKLDPLNLSIHMELTRAMLYNREYKKALEGVNTIIRIRPDYLPAYERKGW
ncbi:MAG TPA: adenylate/guanylate cyclase domain-containing protein, partial [Saprospiraceae bacterium]|nr:adenylate/guanylate cyclase domain-containing protein [Saprospiraceae bacterium]